MSNCKFCGQQAGLLRKQHKECLDKHNTGRKQILSIMTSSLSNDKPPQSIWADIKNIANKSFIEKPLIYGLIIKGWELTVDKAFDDGVLSLNEEERLNQIMEYFKLTQKHLDKHGAYSKMIKGSILREVLDGNIPERVNIEGNIPFNLQKNEQIVWLFNDVDYYELRKRRQYVGGYGGVSLRIAKGVCYRAGAFKGHPVDTSETVKIDSGIFAITNKHVYFGGTVKNLRIAYNKVVTFTPYSDGIGIQRDAASAKPQTFFTNDGWFTYNLIANLAKI